MTDPCAHDFGFAGVVYRASVYLRPGTDARDMVYEDRMVCRKCLLTRDINPRSEGNSYSKPIAGTTPK